MGFGDLKTKAGLEALNTFLVDKSYLEGFVPSQADVAVFCALAGAPPAELNHALRWYNQVASYKSEHTSLPGVQKPLDQYGPSTTPMDADEDDSDDDDIFGSDEEEDEETARIKAERLAAYKAKKSTKPALIAKSIVTLDVKPLGDDTDMKEVERLVRQIETDGLNWTVSKLADVAYGIKKLVITCVVEDDKVSTDWLEEQIMENEDLVQSVDIASFQKV